MLFFYFEFIFQAFFKFIYINRNWNSYSKLYKKVEHSTRVLLKLFPISLSSNLKIKRLTSSEFSVNILQGRKKKTFI